MCPNFGKYHLVDKKVVVNYFEHFTKALHMPFIKKLEKLVKIGTNFYVSKRLEITLPLARECLWIALSILEKSCNALVPSILKIIRKFNKN